MKVQFDAHVHVHPGFDVGRICENIRSIDAPLLLCLAETSAGGEFARVRNHTAVSTTSELGSLRLTSDRPAYFIYGRQLVSRDRLEVLALGLDPTDPMSGATDGEATTADLVDRVLESGALAVLPWGVGKWVGARGKIVHALAATPRLWRHPRFFLGDIAARARLVPAPPPFREPVRVLVGSDPLNLSDGVEQVAVYRNEVELEFDPDRPRASLLTALEEGAPVRRRGRVLGIGHAARDQVRLRRGGRGRPSVSPVVTPATDVDIAVIGAGIHGASAAYEAVRRGYSVALIDRGDLGGGASSNSLKILHGGLRYLQHGDVRRSRESIREQRRWLQLAPFLTAPLPCRLEASGARRWLLRAGLVVNDALSIDRNRDVVSSRRLPRSSAGMWHDAIVLDTERLLLALVHSATTLGGDAFRVHVHDGAEVKPDGEAFRVHLNGGKILRAGRVIRSVGTHRNGQPVGLSMNLVLDIPPLDGQVALALPHPHDGRNIFAVPWRGRAMVGTFDRDYPLDPALPLRLDLDWVDEALAWMAPSHSALTSLTRRNVRFVHAGLVPRTHDGSATRSDAVLRESSGLVDMIGVKYTTAYGVACRAVDLAAGAGATPPERAGADTQLEDVRPRIDSFCRKQERGSEVLGSGGPRLGEVVFAVRHEWAMSLDDVLLRRTGTASAGHPGDEVVAKVAAVLAEEFGWSDHERAAAVAAFDANPHFAGNVG